MLFSNHLICGPSKYTIGQAIQFNYNGKLCSGTITVIEKTSDGTDYNLTIDSPELGQKKFRESLFKRI